MTNQPAADAAHPIRLDVWSDLVSPWGYIAKRRIEAAIHAFERPHEVTVRFRAYEVDPDAPVGERMGVTEYLSRKHGQGDRHVGHMMTVRVSEAAVDDRIRFDWEHAVRANTFNAHRLVALALEMGGPALQSATVERFFSAHFGEGLALDDPEVLQRISAEAGLDERRVASVLADDSYAAEVRADEEAARSLGVTTVPHVVADGGPSLSGIQSVEEYLGLLRSVATVAG
ncbi:MAG TPA: DsbA family oxidoreductase [Intrasporangium sp.]|uniref:DsbA family oxidoreductase n=1 Tax=Intrasporangium sp. TaxID=1925024 RepID=UPI002D770D22|nr:DsbA family oxidoreductase [Intrasporangium sp.]HET7398771.1 DsbA family oxidoreductase [Intrasporangium sp.]